MSNLVIRGSLALITLLFAVMLSACAEETHRDNILLNGSVYVNMNYSSCLGSHNSLHFRFNKAGSYKIKYGIPGSNDQGDQTLVSYDITEPGDKLIKEDVEFSNKTTIHHPLVIVISDGAGITDSVILN